MPEISMTIKEHVRTTSYQGQEVSMSIHGIPDDVTDEQMQALIDGPIEKGFRHLSNAVHSRVEEMRAKAVNDMVEAVSGVQ